MKITFTKFSKLLFVASLLITLCSEQVSAQTPQYTYTNNATGGNWIPFGVGNGWDNCRSQFLYLPGDFPALPSNTTPGFMTAIYFKAYYATTNFSMTGVQVDIGNTTLTAINSYQTGLTPAVPTKTVNIGAVSVGGWFKIPLDNYVYMDPTKPFIIDFRQTGGTDGPPAYAGGTPVNGAYTGNTHVYTYASGSGARRYSYQFGFDFFAGYPCTDTPKAEVDGPVRVCPNKPYTLKPSKYYADATYQWQYSKNGSTWSNFTGVPGLLGDITDSITSAKYYRVKITCDSNTNLTWTSAAHKIEIAPFYYCYCDNYATSTDGADIGNVTMINLQSFDTVVNNGIGMPLYNNSKANRKYTSMHDSISWPCLYRDTTYRFLLTQIHSTNTLQKTYVQAYIDFDRDGLYNPNTERLFLTLIDGSGNPPEVADINYKIPSGAEIGPTGMRLVISTDSVQGPPCDSLPGAGEVEDYIVKICHRPCDGPVNAGTVSSTDTSMCPDYEYKLTDTTFEKGRSAFTRAWQVSGDNISWFNISGSLDKDTLQRVFTGQPLYYRLRTVCPSTLDTNFSQATLVNAKPGYKCYCYSKATGAGIDSSDIGSISFGGISTYDGGPHIMNSQAVKPRTDHTDAKFQEFYTDSMYAFYVYHTMNALEHGDAKVTIFMDFNNNKQYDIPEERIFTGYTTIGSHTLVDSIKIPVKAIRDVPTGARFIINNDIAPSAASDSACGGYLSGETEDFIVIFRKKIPQSVSGINCKLSGFGIHPNPTTGNVTLSFDAIDAVDDVQVRVTNMTGQTVFTQQYNVGGTEFTQDIDLNGQPAGVYFVELNADGERLIRKLMIQ
ncbi:MAG: T9SS type A sorting domain-containing protein [Chitinophagales bacterium]|nr:T9SS type A sorting domain-containing protein [Chitinophagales bacterium]